MWGLQALLLLVCLGGVSTDPADLMQLVSFPLNDDKQNWLPGNKLKAKEASGLAHSPDPGKPQSSLVLEEGLVQQRGRAASAGALASALLASQQSDTVNRLPSPFSSVVYK